MTAVIIIIVSILLILGIFFLFRGNRFFRKHADENAIVFGGKGKGKTLFFSCLAQRFSKDKTFNGYVSNTDFGFKGGQVADPSIVSVAPNTWEDVLNGNITEIEKNRNLERRAVLLDDAGVYLPNFADSLLKKHYESMPVAFAVWRHLYDSPILINSQDPERSWKMLREQQVAFWQVRGLTKIGRIGILRYTFYDRAESASKRLEPMGSILFNKFNKAEANKFAAEHGTVFKSFLIFDLKKHSFDSRYFHFVFFHEPAPKKKKK